MAPMFVSTWIDHFKRIIFSFYKINQTFRIFFSTLLPLNVVFNSLYYSGIQKLNWDLNESYNFIHTRQNVHFEVKLIPPAYINYH